MPKLVGCLKMNEGSIFFKRENEKKGAIKYKFEARNRNHRRSSFLSIYMNNICNAKISLCALFGLLNIHINACFFV